MAETIDGADGRASDLTARTAKRTTGVSCAGMRRSGLSLSPHLGTVRYAPLPRLRPGGTPLDDGEVR